MQLEKRYNQVRQYTENICSALKTEDYIPQAAVFASPPKWHLAHTTWFFEKFILENYVQDYKVFHEDFSFLFNSYYNQIGERINRFQRGVLTRPTVDKVYAYRAYVDQKMLEFIQAGNQLDLVELGLQHEQQHQELLWQDIKYLFAQNPLFPKYSEELPFDDKQHAKGAFITFGEGVFEVGFDGEGFCFDNELGRHKRYIEAFEISSSLVSNEEYIAFIKDGGYTNANWWLDEGWSWVQENKIEGPLYWLQKEGKWFNYKLSGLSLVDLYDVVSHVSYYEAAAFAEWKGMRLPTEFEWELASDAFKWGQRWEWTNSAYLAYPGFRKADGAVGEYNGKFMLNQMVLKGGSVATSKDHSRKSYRNFYHPNMQWQFSGIRLVKDVK